MVLVSNFLMALLTFWTKFIKHMKNGTKVNSNMGIWSIGGFLRYLIFKCLPADARPKSKLAANLLSSLFSAFEDSSWFIISAFLVWSESALSEDGICTTMSSWMSVIGLESWSDANLDSSSESPVYHINQFTNELQESIINSRKNSPFEKKASPLAGNNTLRPLPTIFEAEAHVLEEEANDASSKWDLNIHRFMKTDKSLDVFHAVVSAFRPGVVGALLSASFSLYNENTKIQYMNLCFLLAYLSLRFSHLLSRNH